METYRSICNSKQSKHMCDSLSDLLRPSQSTIPSSLIVALRGQDVPGCGQLDEVPCRTVEYVLSQGRMREGGTIILSGEVRLISILIITR